MKTKRPLAKTEYIVGAFFALTALLPLATTDDGYVIDVLPPLASLSLPAADQIETGDMLPQVLELPAIGDPS